jgi:hypothetical protein
VLVGFSRFGVACKPALWPALGDVVHDRDDMGDDAFLGEHKRDRVLVLIQAPVFSTVGEGRVNPKNDSVGIRDNDRVGSGLQRSGDDGSGRSGFHPGWNI